MNKPIRFVLVGQGKPAEVAARAILGLERVELIAIFAPADRDAVLKSIAGKHDINYYSDKTLKSPEGAELLSSLEPDWLLSSNSTILFPARILEVPRVGSLNFHPGLLPEYAGLHTHQWAIRHGLDRFGVSIHRMAVKVDAGDVVLTELYEIPENATGLQVFKRALDTGAVALNKVLSMIARGEELPTVKQDLSNRQLYRHKDALDGRIDWSWSAEQIRNFVRAGNYLPFQSPTYTAHLDDPAGIEADRVHVYRVKPVDLENPAEPGQVVAVEERGPVVACGNGNAVAIVDSRQGRASMDSTRWDQYFDSLGTKRLRGRS